MSSSPPLGFGACGFGSSAFGWGTPAAANSSTPFLLRQDDGSPGEVRKIDTVTGDYVLDAQGRAVGWDALSQKVYLAVRTKLGSAADTTVGIDLPQGTITDDLSNRIKLAVQDALKPLTDANLVTIVGIDVTRRGVSSVLTVVRWQATAGGDVQATTIGGL